MRKAVDDDDFSFCFEELCVVRSDGVKSLLEVVFRVFDNDNDA